MEDFMMEKKKGMMDANKTPLGKPPPNYPKPPSTSSLLKPSYLSGDGYEPKPPPPTLYQQYEQYQSSPTPVTSQPSPYVPPQPPKFSHYEYESYSVQPPLPPNPPALNFSGQFGMASNHTQNKIVPSNYSKWDSPFPVKRENDDSNDSDGDGRSRERKRKRRTRWMGSENEKAVIPGMPTILPPGIPPEQAEAYISQLQIEELTRKLRTGDLGIPPNPEDRSPSPEPIYGTDGKRLNTRDYRTRKKLEDERHRLIQKLLKLNPDYKAPADYRAPVVKIVDRVSIPQEEHPEINFVGLLIGPRGNTLKGLEKDTGAKIIIRGKGSVKEGKVGGKAGLPLPGEDEPLHAYVTSNNPESVKKACDKIKDIIRQGIEMPESQNDLRKNQLRELALLNGTLREGEGPKCSNCGATSHRTWNCPDKPNVTNSVICTVCGGAGHIGKDCKIKRPGLGGPPIINPNDRAKIDEEYMSLMAELLGEGNPGKEGSPARNAAPTHRPHSTPNLFQRPQTPRQIMAAGPPQGNINTSSTSALQASWSNHSYQQHGHQQTQQQPPPPPGMQAAMPPPPSQSYLSQSWNSQPPPPGMYWQPPSEMYHWQPPPPPPPESNQPPPPPPQ